MGVGAHVADGELVVSSGVDAHLGYQSILDLPVVQDTHRGLRLRHRKLVNETLTVDLHGRGHRTRIRLAFLTVVIALTNADVFNNQQRLS